MAGEHVLDAVGPNTTPRFFPTMRITVILQAAAMLTQAITAGLLMSSPDGRALHGVTAVVAVAAGAIQLLMAILVWRPGGGSPRYVVNSTFLLVLTLAEAALGDTHVPAVHVPLGVLLFGGSVVLLSRVWSRAAAMDR
ncbi:hypothetical protein [Nonomuraea guangzhouensis]|uniref:Uncharacterized protein n=1 Tax=Nonomuraea guangzhouensis TaxID=1291555 RepID=A0ABW4G9R3_9ACTN|nr:hypothetical protein [Nonomuraea guangzhouensis]